MKPLTHLSNVWLCDDDADDHYVFREALEQVIPGAALTIYHNGSELLDHLHRQKPDILFLDINMPMINGLEALKEIREKQLAKGLPIVMYSVSEQTIDINASYHFGATLYMVKPMVFQELVRQLRLVFELNWNTADPFTSFRFDGEKFIPVRIAG